MEQQNSAKFAFYYMLSLVALVFMSVSTGIIVFQIINKKIVDAIGTMPGVFNPEALKFAISAIIISAPIFYVLAWQINKSLFKGYLDKNAGVRKWLTYFILLVSAVVMIGWLIATLNNFLNGELTTKFILKAITAILISAIIFSYYLYDIRRENVVNIKDKIIRIYFYGSLAVVLAALITSFFFVESPTQTRMRKQDNAILEKFDKIDGAINGYYSENKKLPAKFEDIMGAKTGYYLQDEDIKDPITKEKFIYKTTGKDTYELCATFRTANKNDDPRINYLKDKWSHEAGQQCLGQKARSEAKELAPVVR